MHLSAFCACIWALAGVGLGYVWDLYFIILHLSPYSFFYSFSSIEYEAPKWRDRMKECNWSIYWCVNCQPSWNCVDWILNMCKSGNELPLMVDQVGQQVTRFEAVSLAVFSCSPIDWSLLGKRTKLVCQKTYYF